MSTRCQIKLTFGETKIWIYRHHDGNFAETGRDLYLKLNDATFTYFLNDLINDHKYEVTFMQHGDIEYQYEFEWSSETKLAKIKCSHINTDGTLKGDFFISSEDDCVYGFADFIKPYANGTSQQINDLIKELDRLGLHMDLKDWNKQGVFSVKDLTKYLDDCDQRNIEKDILRS